jgi:hypothetical protein
LAQKTFAQVSSATAPCALIRKFAISTIHQNGSASRCIAQARIAMMILNRIEIAPETVIETEMEGLGTGMRGTETTVGPATAIESKLLRSHSPLSN